jgi:hypothetical protein
MALMASKCQVGTIAQSCALISHNLQLAATTLHSDGAAMHACSLVHLLPSLTRECAHTSASEAGALEPCSVHVLS